MQNLRERDQQGQDKLALAALAAVHPHCTPFGEGVVEFLLGLECLYSMRATTVCSTIMGNCFLGFCQNPIDPYII
jgi:hypothetical protein